ncbi:MAG: SAM-dependent methyltransferase [Planctomycetota bacterium]|jgi:23S rRNA (cytidine1920-2'-O)/16S rRNA (cytidine1409-2'-O)-methyltransferase
MATGRFVSRAGAKLDHALEVFGIDVAGRTCADFGCNVGGFTDCLLRRGAARVFAVDTGYGTLAWSLRSDDRVVVMERTNALHAEPPDGRVDLVTADVGWTPQRRIVPAALRWLAPGGVIVSLVKPHYELGADERRDLLVDGRLPPEHAARILERVTAQLPALGVEVVATTRSPLTGAKSGRGAGVSGNVEFLAFLRPLATP